MQKKTKIQLEINDKERANEIYKKILLESANTIG